MMAFTPSFMEKGANQRSSVIVMSPSTWNDGFHAFIHAQLVSVINSTSISSLRSFLEFIRYFAMVQF